MKPSRVLWFVEHLAREFDVACAVKCLAEARYPLSIRIRNIYLHAKEVLTGRPPHVVVHPFFYFATGALGTEHYVKAWPRAAHFNLAWEELFYSANARIKGPSDDFARHRVIHHAWGEFYRRFLESHGVPPAHIFVNGNPAYQLYKPPYSKIAVPREELARRHGISPTSTWLFIPENYRWAFTAESKLRRMAASEDHLAELLKMKEHCIESLGILVKWCTEVARPGETDIILRPRPATNTQHMLQFIESAAGKPGRGFHVIKDGSVREWILASDVVLSSFSTSLIEASIAGKPLFMFEPTPLPEGLSSSWYRYAEHVKTKADFERAARAGRWSDNWRRLSEWAHEEMLAKGDPIAGLADLLGQIASTERGSLASAPRPGPLGAVCRWIASRRARIQGRRTISINPETHEHDDFTDADTEARVKAWSEILLGGPTGEGTRPS